MTAIAQKRVVLRVRALWELLRYDAVLRLFGFRAVRSGLRPIPRLGHPAANLETVIAHAIDWAGAFYWKRVLCLQRAMAATRLMRAYGIRAQLVIGCQAAPFVGHAWVEVDGRSVTGLSATQEDLQVLDRV